MKSSVHSSGILMKLMFPFIISLLLVPLGAQVTIPSRVDGFWYENRLPKMESVVIEAFFDPVCPDSRDSWPPLRQALQYFGSRASLLLHTFPLPYHDNAFVTSRALHIINNKLNASATYQLLDSFFNQQEQFYGKQTFNLSRKSVVNLVTNFVTNAVGKSYYSAVASGFKNPHSDQQTRISFKYGCSRGVFGTPFFFVNGFALADSAGSALDYKGWRNIIDPLVDV